jgi:HipA-like kinase
MPIDARRLIRKMRGGAQAHLIEAGDGHFYVVKFLNNPQHRRILVNEWIASAFLGYLGIATPEAGMVRVSEAFLSENPDTHIQLGSRRQPVEPGWHFGSRFPGDPARNVVYDFLPDSLLERVENLGDFRAALAFDKWLGNADSRQAIFFRARLKDWLETASARLGFVTQMVDNGFAFEGPHWRFTESPIQGLYFRPMVYSGVRGLDDFQPWLDRIVNFPEEVVDQTVKQIPTSWLEGDEDALHQLLDRLLARRRRVPDLIEACRGGRLNPFPSWR